MADAQPTRLLGTCSCGWMCSTTARVEFLALVAEHRLDCMHRQLRSASTVAAKTSTVTPSVSIRELKMAPTRPSGST